MARDCRSSSGVAKYGLETASTADREALEVVDAESKTSKAEPGTGRRHLSATERKQLKAQVLDLSSSEGQWV